MFALIFLAVFISVGREMAPLLKENQSRFEGHLSAMAGVMVRMQSVSASWEGLLPEIDIKGLQIGDSAMIETVTMRVDLLSSVLSRTLVFDQLALDSATIDIHVDSNKTKRDEENEKKDFSVVQRLLFNSQTISLKNIQINLFNSTGGVLQAELDDITVGNSGKQHWLNTRIAFNDMEKPIVFQASFNGSATNILAGDGRAFFDLGDKNNFKELWQFLNDYEQQEVLSHFSLGEGGGVSGGVWLDWEAGQISAVSDIEIEKLQITSDLFNRENNTEKSIELDFEGQFFIEKTPVGVYQFSVVKGELSVDSRQWTLPRSLVSYRPNSLNLSLFIPNFSFSELYPFYDLVNNQKTRSVLQTLEPTGDLSNIEVTIPLEKSHLSDFRFSASLHNIAVSAWNGSPALEQVNGYVESQLFSGFIELDSVDGFSMHYPQIYSQPLSYNKAKGRVHWEIEPDEKVVYVGGKNLDLLGDEGYAQGGFWLYLPLPPSDADPELYIAAGLKKSHVRFRHKYLPSVLPKELVDWLDGSIKAGDIIDNGFIYRGSLADNADERSLQYYANVENGELLFDPSWPLLSNLKSVVLVDDDDVRSYMAQANFHQLALQNAVLNVSPSLSGKGQVIRISGDVAGSGNDALQLLTDTPIHAQVGSAFDDWTLSGSVSGNARIVVPLGGASEEARQEANIHFSDNVLRLQNLQLQIDDISGDLSYSSIDGLVANELKVKLWEENQIVRIDAIDDGDEHKDIRLVMTGRLNKKQLMTWSKVSLLGFLDGDIPVRSELSIPIDPHNEGQKEQDEKAFTQPILKMKVTSNLKGVAIDLPSPLDKQAKTKEPFLFNMSLWPDRQIYRVEYQDLLQSYYVQPDTGVPYGHVQLKSRSVEGSLPGLLVDNQNETTVRVDARLERVNLDDWLAVIDRYTVLQNDISGSAASGVSPVFNLQIGQFLMADTAFNSVEALIDWRQADVNDGAYWNVGFTVDFVQGDFKIFDDGRLSELELDRINLDQIPAEPSKNSRLKPVIKSLDPLANSAPQDMTPMEVTAERVIYDEQDFGQWHFIVEPINTVRQQGVRLNDFQIQDDSFSIRGESDEQPANILWLNESGAMHTRFNGAVLINDMVTFSEKFGVESILESELLTLSGELEWPGSPALFDFKASQGNVNIDAKKGKFFNSSSATGAMRVVNVFNFNTWARRLKLDFSDLSGGGLSFDSVNGDVGLNNGVMSFDTPLIMDSPSSKFTMMGVVDNIENTIDARMAVTLPVKDNVAWVTALAAGLPIGLGVYVASKVFSEQIENMSSLSYSISGDLDDPAVEFQHLLKDLTALEANAPEAPQSVSKRKKR